MTKDTLQSLNEPHPQQFIDFMAILNGILCVSLLGKQLISLQKSKLDLKII